MIVVRTKELREVSVRKARVVTEKQIISCTAENSSGADEKILRVGLTHRWTFPCCVILIVNVAVSHTLFKRYIYIYTHVCLCMRMYLR